MKILLFTKSVALFCLLLTEVRSWENFKIVRETSPRDTFTIPPSKCDKNNDTFDYCSEYNAAAVKGQRCQCGCHDKYATFSFYKQSWSCLKNEDARTFFGCSQPTFFKGEKEKDKLSLLESGSDKEIPLKSSNCNINAISSWYIDCDGKQKATYASVGNTFEMEEESRAYNLEVGRLLTSNPLKGRIVKLGISCSSQGQHNNENYCLLFKLRGNTSCPVTVTRTTTATKVVDEGLKSAPPEVLTPPSSAADQNSADNVSTASLGVIVGVTVAVILIVLLVGHFIYRKHSARKHPRTISEGQSSQSDSGSHPSDQNDGYETLSNYRSTIYTSNYEVPNGGSERLHLRLPRAPSSSEGHDNNGLDREEPFYHTVDELFSNCNGRHEEYVDPVTSERSRDFGPLSVEQRVYNMIEALKTDTSVSPYDNGSNEDNQDHVPLSVDELFSNCNGTDEEYVDPVTSERSRDFGPLSVEQRVYNMIEALNTNTSDSPCDNGSNEENQNHVPLSVDELFSNFNGTHGEYVDPVTSERSRDIGPLSVEQLVYNMIEVLNTNTSNSPYDNGSKEGNQDHLPLSVEQPVYNIMEAFETVTGEESNSSDPRHKETPVYNVLEKPLPKDAGDIKKTCSSIVKDPVYNILEGPDADKTDEPSNETMCNIKQQDNNSSTFLYAVA